MKLLLKPVGYVFGWVNAATTAYVVGKIGWHMYLNIRAMQKEKLQANEMRTKFVEMYREKFGKDPDEELISVTLASHNYVEHPLRQKIATECGKVKKAFEETMEKVNQNGKS